MVPRTRVEAGSNQSKPARIEHLHVENYRALRSIELKGMTPLTVLLGPNGSGKSTIFDVFNFLSECFRYGLRNAWDRRGRGKEIRTRGQSGPVVIELKYREKPDQPTITYHLAINEEQGGPFVQEEWLQWRRGTRGRPFRFLDYRNGVVQAVSGEFPDETDRRVETRLRSRDLIAVNTLGQLAENPRVAALREFITDWYVSYLSITDTRSQPEVGPKERLSKTGDNLPNVVQYLMEQHPLRFHEIVETLQQRIPRLEGILASAMPDGRLLLQFKDEPFDEPILSKFASDGTLKMLSYLVVLHDPSPAQFIGIEEPENYLHPRLLRGLAEECRRATDHSQLLVATHSPFFVNGTRPNEVRVLFRNQAGHTQVKRASDIPGVSEFVQTGGSLGDLWMEGHLGVGDPLVNSGAPVTRGLAE